MLIMSQSLLLYSSKTRTNVLFQKSADVVEELSVVLRNQQRELTELRSQMESMQSSILSRVEHVLTNHQEQERILSPLRCSSFCLQTCIVSRAAEGL